MPFGPGWSGARVVALAGGVGGSRFVRGLHLAAPAARLTAIVNTGDDLTRYGLRISPDVDTVLYALAGIVDDVRGWGPRGDTFRAMAALERLGGDAWFRLGDLDLGTHLRRRELLDAGRAPSEVIAELAQRLGIGRVPLAGPPGGIGGSGVTVLPMTDDPVETWIQLAGVPPAGSGVSPGGSEDDRWIPFQEYFVRRRADVPISAVRFDGIERSRPAPGLLDAVGTAHLVVLCPSNPIVSIGPILGVPGIRDAILAARSRGAIVAGVSPLIGGATVKGPAARMLREMGVEPSAAGVASMYADLLDIYVIDRVDAALASTIEEQGARPIVTDALMRGRPGERRLAREVLRAALGPARAA
jgi:LPPG:FO 2-phospho-L-lactate transferase